jgi:sporulation protein YlmC with PRC-barrel domain
MDTNENIKDFNRLQELTGSDYEMVDGEPNIKGWSVNDSLGKHAGKVKELLFNPSSRLVRYLILKTDNAGANREVLIPVGFAQLHESDDLVVLDSVTVDQLALLPAYIDIHVAPVTESEIRRILNGMESTKNDDVFDADFYNHNQFNTERLYSQRRK